MVGGGAMWFHGAECLGIFNVLFLMEILWVHLFLKFSA